MTARKQTILDNTKSKVTLFAKEIFLNGIKTIPVTYIHKLSKHLHLFIFIEDLYSLYEDWYKSSNNGRIMNKINFSRKIYEFEGITDADRQIVNRKRTFIVHLSSCPFLIKYYIF